MDIIKLTHQLAAERTMRRVKVKPGCEAMALLALENAAKAQQELYPEIFDPADEDMLSKIADGTVKQSPALFAGAEKSKTAESMNANERASYLRHKGII